MTLTPDDVITWDDYRREDGQETLGLLSQISPDGRYVLSTVKDLSVFMANPPGRRSPRRSRAVRRLSAIPAPA
jgi:hypothetical protein